MGANTLYMLFSDKKGVDTYVFGSEKKWNKEYNELDKNIYRKLKWNVDSFIWCFHCGVLTEKDRHVYKYAMLFWKAFYERHWDSRHPFPDDIKELADNLNIKDNKDASVFIIQEFANMILRDIEKLNNVDKSFKWVTCEEHDDGSFSTRVWDEKPYKTKFDTWLCDKGGRHFEMLEIYYLANMSLEDKEPTLIENLIHDLESELEIKIQEIKRLKGEE